MKVNNEDIVKLRKASGQPIMDCKKALQETNSFDEAFEFLRKTATEKIDSRRKDRIISEGRVIIKCSHEFPVYGSKIAMVSLLCETDFTANSESFINALVNIAGLLIESNNDSMKLIKKDIEKVQAQTGERIQLGQTYVMTVPENASIGTYVHFDNKKAAIVQFEAKSNPALLQKLGKEIAMHVVATKPMYLDKDEFKSSPGKVKISPPEGIENKPPEIQNKIMSGMLRKQMKELVLLEQPFCLNEDITVEQAILEVRKEEMMEIELTKFRHIEIGE